MKGVINRKTYLEMKKMDHQHMEEFLERLYKNAYEDGRKAAEGLNETQLREILLSVKGIGERRTEAVLERIKEAMEKGDSHEST